MGFYRGKILSRALKLEILLSELKSKSIISFKAYTLTPKFLWRKAIPVKTEVRIISDGHLCWASSKQHWGMNGIRWLANSLSLLALALWGHNTDTFIKNCRKVCTTPACLLPVMWASGQLQFVQTTGLSIKVTQKILNDILAPGIES